MNKRDIPNPCRSHTEPNKIISISSLREPRGNFSASQFRGGFFLSLRRSRTYDTDHQCCPRDRQQDIFCSFELRRVPFVPRSSRWSTIGIGKRKRPPKTRLPRSRLIYRRLLDRFLLVKGVGKKKKRGKIRRVSRIEIVARLFNARVAMLGHRLSAASRRNVGAMPEHVRERPRTSKRRPVCRRR